MNHLQQKTAVKKARLRCLTNPNLFHFSSKAEKMFPKKVMEFSLARAKNRFSGLAGNATYAEVLEPIFDLEIKSCDWLERNCYLSCLRACFLGFET